MTIEGEHPLGELDNFDIYYDREGRRISMNTFVQLCTDEYRRIGRDEIAGAVVSTIWIGIDASAGFTEPLIFETMIFGGRWDRKMWRHTDEETARTIHARIVDALDAGADPRRIERAT